MRRSSELVTPAGRRSSAKSSRTPARCRRSTLWPGESGDDSASAPSEQPEGRSAALSQHPLLDLRGGESGRFFTVTAPSTSVDVFKALRPRHWTFRQGVVYARESVADCQRDKGFKVKVSKTSVASRPASFIFLLTNARLAALSDMDAPASISSHTPRNRRAVLRTMSKSIRCT